MRKISILSIIPLFLLACGSKQQEVEKIIENGVEVVINHIEPYSLDGEPAILRLEEALSIDTEKEEIAETGLTEFENFCVDLKGRIYCMMRSSSDFFIYKFDETGKFQTKFGRKGQGPGEFEWGGDIHIDENDRIIAKDMTKEKYYLFDGEGNLIRESRQERNFSLIAYLKEGKFFVRDWSRTRREDGSRIDYYGKSDSSFSDIADFYHYEMEDPQTAVKYTPVPGGFAIGISQKHVFIGHSNEDYEILVYDLQGNLVKKIRKSYVPVEIPDAYKRLTKKSLERFTAGKDLIKKMYYPPHWPPFRYLFTDDQERLYVMTYETAKNGWGYIYDIFNSEGVFIGRISLGNIQVVYMGEERYMDRPAKALIKGGFLYSLGEKENSFMELKKYRMVWE